MVLAVEESQAKLPHTRYGVGGRSLHLEDLAPLLIRRGVRGILSDSFHSRVMRNQQNLYS